MKLHSVQECCGSWYEMDGEVRSAARGEGGNGNPEKTRLAVQNHRQRVQTCFPCCSMTPSATDTLPKSRSLCLGPPDDLAQPRDVKTGEGNGRDLPQRLRGPRTPARTIDVKNAKSTGVSVFETLFETPNPGLSAF